MMSVVTARSAIAALAASEPGQVALGGVAPAHGREDAVAARLQRQVELLADRRRSRPWRRSSRAGGPSDAGS